jgi:hypothetical protein
MRDQLCPADVRFLMHVYALAEPYRGTWPSWLVSEGYIEDAKWDPMNHCGWRLTEGGEMLVAAILATPIPVQKWTMP